MDRGWQPSVRSVRPRDSAGCQSQDSTEKMEYALSLVSCRLTLTGLALNYSVSAPLLCSSLLFFFLLSSSRSLQYVCALRKKHAEKKKREESGGRVASTYKRLPGDSIEHQEFPEAVKPPFIVWIYLLTYTKDLFSITQHTLCFIDCTINADHHFSLDITATFSIPVKWIAYIYIYNTTLNFMFYVSTLTNKVN